MNKETYISDRSLVQDSKIGSGVKIWHYCNIYGCTIGDDTQVGSYCEFKSNVTIGRHCRFQSYVFVPEGTVIQDYVFVGPHVTFTNDKYPSAAKAIAGTWEEKAIFVEEHAVIGAGAVLSAGVRIGTRAVVGAGSCVTRDVAPYSVVCGNPARKIGDVRDAEQAAKYQSP